MRRTVFGLITLLIMLLIFSFSAQDGAASGEQSAYAAKIIRDAGLEPAVPPITGGGLESDLRKWAHILLYFCLGISEMCFVNECLRRPDGRKPTRSGRLAAAAGLTAAGCLAWACLDEWHQTFTPARSGCVADVGVDACGFLPGIALAVLGIRLLADRAARRSDARQGRS